MTEVASVSGQIGARPGAALAKGAKGTKGAGADSALDAAFAALFGKASAGEGNVFAKLTASPGKPAKAPADPAPADAAPGDAAASATVDLAQATSPELLTAGQAVTEPEPSHVDPATGKPRKSTRGKGQEPQSPDPLLAGQAAVAAHARADAPGQAVADDRTEAAAAAITTVTTTAAVAADIAKPGSAPDAMKGKQAGRALPEHAQRAGSDATQSSAAQPQQLVVANQQSDPSGQDDRGRGDARERKADNDLGQIAATNDTDAVLTASADPLRDIVQSLPPVVQSQLTASASTSAIPATASTGELLNNHVIDMGVSGQWIDRMAREIASLADGTGHSRFQLSPPNLGKIQVDLWQGGDKMNLRLVAETDEAARRLREGQDALQADARIASLALGSVSVEKAATPLDSARDPNQRQDGQQNANPNQQNFAQAQGQPGQGRGNSSANLNRGGSAAVIGSERQAELGQDARTPGAGDPRDRFA